MLFSIYTLSAILELMELDLLSDQEIAARMVDYINRTNNLFHQVSLVINGKSSDMTNKEILTEYKALKKTIQEDADWLKLSRNTKRDNSVLQTRFRWPIVEASAWGFTAKVNSRINIKLLSSIEEARYKLQKGTSIEEWHELMLSKQLFVMGDKYDNCS